MEVQKRNLEGLIEFLELAMRNGYVNAGTGNNRIRIVKEVLNTVPNIDTTDITKIDLEDIFNRYTTLMATKVPNTTLLGNRAHFRSAIREFSTFLADPIHYKPESARTTKKNIPSKISTPKPPVTEKQPDEISEVKIPSQDHGGLATPTIHIDFQIHIAPDTDPQLVEKIFESLSKYFPNK